MSDEARFQGRYAGGLARLLAFGVDLLVVNVVIAATLALVQFAIDTCTPWTVDFKNGAAWLAVVYFVWWAIYLGASWIVFARSPGMALLGLRIVCGDGSALGPKRAFIRLLCFPLGFLTLGIGFLGIILGRRHQALYDRIARTAVIFHWDEEAARLRHLATEGRSRRAARQTPDTV
jgi:uncharacterized RDD family membrane protein YckC